MPRTYGFKHTGGQVWIVCESVIDTVDGYQEFVALDTRHFWERFGQCVNLLNNTVDELPEPVVF